MAQNIFELSKASKSYNQGTYGVPVVLKRMRAGIMTPLDFEIDPADLATIQAFFNAAAINDDPAQRIQVLDSIEGYEPQNTDAQPFTLPYGSSVFPYDGQTGGLITFGDLDMQKHALRQKFNDEAGSWLMLIIDEKGQIGGTNSANGKVRGFSLYDFRATDIQLDPGTGVAQTARVVFADRTELNGGNLRVLPTSGFSIKNIRNVSDVNIVVIADLATRVVTVAFMSASSNYNENLALRYASELVATPDLLIGTNHGTGAALTIDTAVPAVINGQHGITYTFDITNFPSVGGSIDLKLDVVSALLAGGITYPFETPFPTNIPVT